MKLPIYLQNRLSRLKQPIGFLNTKQDKWLFILFPAIFSPLFLLYFQPFGVNNYDPNNTITLVLVLAVFSFGFTSAVVIGVNEFFLEPIFFMEKNWWQLIAWTAWTLLLASMITFLNYNYLGNWHDWYWSSFIDFIWNVSVMTLIPISMVYFFLYHKSLKPQYTNVEKTLYFQSENGKEQLAFFYQDILFLEAQDNYVAIFYLDGQEVRKKLIRSSLKKIQQRMKDTLLLRCHRSYIVNLLQVEQIRGNTHGLTLSLRIGTQIVPVSRQYVSKTKQAFKNIQSTGQLSPIMANRP